MKRKIKMGMVGGGREATIGVIHKMAAQLDGKIELIAGAFSSNTERSRRSGETLGLHCSKISTGEENRLDVRAYGTHASLGNSDLN
jgi:hypothetical protein